MSHFHSEAGRPLLTWARGPLALRRQALIERANLGRANLLGGLLLIFFGLSSPEIMAQATPGERQLSDRAALPKASEGEAASLRDGSQEAAEEAGQGSGKGAGQGSNSDPDIEAINKSWLKAIQGQKAEEGANQSPPLRLPDPGGARRAGSGSADREQGSGEQGNRGDSTGRNGQGSRQSDTGDAGQSGQTKSSAEPLAFPSDRSAAERQISEAPPSQGAADGLLLAGEESSFFSIIWRFGSMMLLLLLGFYLLLRYMRSKMGGPLGRGSNLVKLLVSLPLAPGKFLQIVDVAGQLFVLGVSDSGVRLLTQVENGPVADRIRLAQSQRAPERGQASPLSQLHQFLWAFPPLRALMGVAGTPAADSWRKSGEEERLGGGERASFEAMLSRDSGQELSGDKGQRELARLLQQQRAHLERLTREQGQQL